MQPEESNLLYTEEEIENYISESFANEFQEYMEENPDADTFQFATDYLGYIYIDATMQGASQPYFIDGNYARVEETNDEPILFESKEDNNEFDVDKALKDIQDNVPAEIKHLGNNAYEYKDLFIEIRPETIFTDNTPPEMDFAVFEKEEDMNTDYELNIGTDYAVMIPYYRYWEAVMLYCDKLLNVNKKEEDCTQASSVDAGKVDLVGSKEKEVKTEGKLNKKEIVDGFPAYTKSIGLEPEEADTSILGEYIADIATFNIIDDEDLEILNDADDEIRTKYNLSEPEVWDDLYESKRLKLEYKPVELGDKEHNRDTLFVQENEITRPNDILAVLDRKKVYELNFPNGKKDLVRIYNIEFGYKIVCKSYLSGREFKLDILDMLKDGRLMETDYLVESRKEEAKFKDKVKAIKKSLKKNDKRLSDKNAQDSAEKIAGSMVKKEKEKKEEYYQMSDDEHIIWDSEVDYYDEDYMEDVKNNQYQDYLDNFEPSEPLSYEDWIYSEECYDSHYHWFEDSGVTEWEDLINEYEDYFKEDYDEYVETFEDKPLDFDKWYRNYISDSSYDDWQMLEDDLKENIFPAIDKQLKDEVLLLRGNYGSNYADFRPSGAGGRLFEKGTDDFRDYMSSFDRVCITTQNGVLGAILDDHDGTVSGQFYTLPDGEKFYEMLKLMGFEDIVRESYTDEDFEKYDLNDLMETEFNDSLYYNGLEAKDFEVASDLLVPIKDTISGYTPQGPEGNKTESKEDLDINSNNKYKKVQVNFECDDCGHRENYLYDDITEKDLVELEASDSNTLVGDCPKCNSKYYNMKNYKIIEESKDKTPSKTMYMVMGKYDNGWETVYTSEDKEDAEARLKEYDDNEKEYPHKIMSRSVDLLKDKKVTESEDLSYTDSNANNCKVYYAVNNSGYKSLGLIVNETDKKFQIVAGQKLRTGSKTAKKSKKQIWDMAKELSDKGYEEVRGPSSVAGSIKEESYETQKERTLNDIIDYNFEEAYKDWGSKSFDSKAGFVNNYLEAFSNDVIDGDIDYIEVYEKEIPELKDADKDTKYKLITDYVKNYLNKKYKKEEAHEDMKKEEKEKLVEENGRASIDLHTDLLPIINMYKYELSQRLEDLVDVTVEEEDELMLDYAKPKIEEEIKSVLSSAEITFGEFSHPRYYKLFTNLNDTLDFTVSYDVSEYEALREKVLHEPEFEQYLKDNYSSYDGFMSFMANNITDFETQEEWKQWVSVVSYCLPNDRNENYQEMLDYVEENLYSTHENIEMAIDYMYETIETKVREEGMELTKENITKVVEDTYINSDSFEYILDGVLREFGLDENKQITENVNINVSEDGKAVEIITDDNEEVNVIDETEEPKNNDGENELEESKLTECEEDTKMKKEEDFKEDFTDALNGTIGAKKGKKIKNNNNWFGVKGAKFNYYGDWADPMVELDGYEYDYYDIEEYVLQCMVDDYKEDGKVIPEENTKEYEAVFNNYMEMEAENALTDLTPYRIASWLEDEIKYTYSISDLDKLIQTLREDTSTPEATINEIEELVNKEKDYAETNNISVDHEEEIVEELQPKIKEILNDMSKYAENMYN